jgi:hypothetical protein
MWLDKLYARWLGRMAASCRSRAYSGRKMSRAWLTVEILEDRSVPAFLPAVISPGPVGPALIGDFNNDFVPDLVSTTYDSTSGTSSVSVRLGLGDGTFQAPVTSAAGTGVLHPVAVCDINHDGNLDVVTSGSVLLGNGDGRFQAPRQNLSIPAGVVGNVVAVGDLNNDGILDLVSTHYVSTGYTSGLRFRISSTAIYLDVALGNGDGSFRPRGTMAIGSGLAIPQPTIVLGDFNGDGNLDALSGMLTTVTLYPGDGIGGFQTPLLAANLVYTGYTGYGVQVGDFNGDRQLDFLVGNQSNRSVTIYLNRGGGTFAAPRSFVVSDPFTFLALADFNHDGNLDVVAVNRTTGTVSVLLGNGDGTLRLVRYFAGGSGASLATVADLNGDRFADLILSQGDGFSVLINDEHW